MANSRVSLINHAKIVICNFVELNLKAMTLYSVA